MALDKNFTLHCWQAIEFSLGCHLVDQAMFYGELLHAQIHNESTAHILGTLYFRDKQFRKCSKLLEKYEKNENKYLMSLSLYKLKKYNESYDVLTNRDKYIGNDIPGGAAGLYLLGCLKEKFGQKENAILLYNECISINPLMYYAYDRLCILKTCVDNEIIKNNNELLHHRINNNIIYININNINKYINNKNIINDNIYINIQNDIIDNSVTAVTTASDTYDDYITGKQFHNKLSTVTSSNLSRHTIGETKRRISLTNEKTEKKNIKKNCDPIAEAVSRQREAWGESISSGGPGWSGSGIGRGRNGESPGGSGGGPGRSGGGLGGSSGGSPGGSSGGVPGGSSGGVPGGSSGENLTRRTSRRKSSTSDISSDTICFASIVHQLGTVLIYLYRFELDKAESALKKINKNQLQRNGYCLELFGRIYFEGQKFILSNRYFKKCYDLCPGRLSALAIWTSVLWQLQKRHELEILCEELVKYYPDSCETYCCLGNCYSLIDHNIAIKYLKKCIYINNEYVMGYTLLGHEYGSNGQNDESINMYQKCIELDSQQYSAWWGLGNIYYKLENWEKAKIHLRKAVIIHPMNSILLCYLAMVYQYIEEYDISYKLYTRSIELDNDNAMALFKKSELLCSMNKYNDCIDLLNKCILITPDEACVYLELGKIYLKINHIDKCFKYLQIAYTLTTDLRAQKVIKAYLDKLSIPPQGVHPPQGYLTNEEEGGVENEIGGGKIEDELEEGSDNNQDREEKISNKLLSVSLDFTPISSTPISSDNCSFHSENSEGFVINRVNSDDFDDTFMSDCI
eukprot:GHVL01015723.1.p1 GENE.GHVL01015723.1~~GHVL01015723.1.p1  ORF type:complete len:799 (+),score=273.96 GHVL01015723.1:334-2730(+)